MFFKLINNIYESSEYLWFLCNFYLISLQFLWGFFVASLQYLCSLLGIILQFLCGLCGFFAVSLQLLWGFFVFKFFKGTFWWLYFFWVFFTSLIFVKITISYSNVYFIKTDFDPQPSTSRDAYKGKGEKRKKRQLQDVQQSIRNGNLKQALENKSQESNGSENNMKEFQGYLEGMFTYTF